MNTTHEIQISGLKIDYADVLELLDFVFYEIEKDFGIKQIPCGTKREYLEKKFYTYINFILSKNKL